MNLDFYEMIFSIAFPIMFGLMANIGFGDWTSRHPDQAAFYDLE